MKLTKYEGWRAGRLGTLCLIAAGLLAIAPLRMGYAQGVSTTTVQGTVYLANGQAGAGTLVVSWPAFTTATGQAVAADSVTVTIPPDGFLSINLAPNVGAQPAGEYYTAVFYMSDGTVSTQYWQVPAGAQATLAQVETQVMPAAQAVQAVSKSYVDQSITELTQSLLTASGGTLSGPLILNSDPTQALQAADKHYVDTQVATDVPLAGGNMTGALATPAVNGVEAPEAGSAQTTLQQAMNAAGTNGAMEIPPAYAGKDTFTNANGVRVTDLRTSGAQQTERSVKEFGAVCDGVTDDTNAMQTALNYANAHGVALTIPEGTCKTRSLNWHGESIGGMGKQVSALMGFPGQDVLASMTDSPNLLQYTRLHDLTIYVDQSVDVSCSAAEGRAAAGSCQVSRPMEKNSIFSPGGNGLTGTVGTGAGWAVGNCAIAMPAATGTGGNGLRVAEIENLEIATTGVDPMAAQYPGAHSTHTCGMYLAQWPQWSEFRNIDMRGLNTGVAIPALPVATPAGLAADSNRWQNITIQATHAFTAAAGCNGVLDTLEAQVGNSAATGEPPTGLALDLPTGMQGWTVRNAVVVPTWNAVPPALTVTAAGGAVTGVTLGTEHGLGWDPYGMSVPLAFSGSCTAQATATVNSNGSIGSVNVTQGGVGCSSTTTASVNAAGTWDTAAPVNLVSGSSMTFFAGNLVKGNGGYTVWNASGAQSFGTQLSGGGGNLPGGGSYPALVATSSVGSALEADQFPGADIGAKIQACLGAVNAGYGGTCDARNFTGSLSMASNLTISTGNTTILLPCATITTANQIVVTAGTRNVALRGCALRGGSAASGSQGGTAFAYSGAGAMVQVGDPTYATDTPGFHMDNVVINTTAATSASAKGLVAYRTQEMDLESLYLLGNGNQTGMTLDGTGNYTGGTFLDNEISGFQTAVNAIGHQVANPATTDWMNASAFVRLHIDCPTSGGSPIGGTFGINLQQGDGNTFTGGDVEGCATALHLGANAQNNTIVGLRNENSTSQVVADAGSSYNNWMTGGTMFTGQLTDNGTRNSFLDTFHRSFNGLNGDWYGSQQDATVTNHYRLGIGTGNERGMLNEVQTDYGYRWLEGYSDATSGEQLYQVEDLLNNVNRLSIGQYNHGQSSTNNQTLINAAGTGAIVLNGSSNAGTGGVTIGSGGASAATVATISNAGNAQFNGTLQVGSTAQSSGTMTVRNSVDAEVDYYLWPGLTATQKGSFTYKDWNGNSQWYLVKDQYNNWAVNSAVGTLDSFKAYQSTNSGDTYIDASNSTGHIRLNYESNAGVETDIYSGPSASLDAAFLGPTSIKLPGLAAGSGHNCLQIDSSGYLTNTGSACGTGSGNGSGTVNSGFAGQIAYYQSNGTALGGMTTIPVGAGGTGTTTVGGAQGILGVQPVVNAANYGLVSDGVTDIGPAVQAALTASNGLKDVVLPCNTSSGCYWANPNAITWPRGTNANGSVVIIQGRITLGTTLALPESSVILIGDTGAPGAQFAPSATYAWIFGPSISGTLGTSISTPAGTAASYTFTPSSMTGIYAGSMITAAGNVTGTIGTVTCNAATGQVTAQLTGAAHIPPNVGVTVAGVANSAFNGTAVSGGFGNFYVVYSDYTLNQITWNQSGCSGSSTGGTVVGLNQDTIEDIPITSTTSTTATATVYRSHASTDTFGVVGVFMNGLAAPQTLRNMTVSGAGGAQIVDDSYNSQLDHVSVETTGACPGGGDMAAFGIDLVQDSYEYLSNVSAQIGCQPASIHAYNWGAAVDAGGEGQTVIRDSNIITGVLMDYGAEGLVFENSGCDDCAAAVIYNPSGWTNQLNSIYLKNVQSNDDQQGFPEAMFLQQTYSSPGGSPNVYEEGGPEWGRTANEYALNIHTDNPTEYGFNTAPGVNGTFDNGKQIEGEIRGEGAAMAPSVIPYATQNVPQSGWTGACTTGSAVPGPDGTLNAYPMTIGSGSNADVVKSITITPATGDVVLFGGLVFTPTLGYSAIASATGSSYLVSNGSSAHYSFNYQGTGYSSVNAYDAGIVNDWWHSAIGEAIVTASDGTSGQTLSLQQSCDSTHPLDYFNPWLIYIPASAGISLAEINRWKTQLMHGYVTPNVSAGTYSVDPNLSATVPWNITGNAATATTATTAASASTAAALASTPSQCSSGQFATGVTSAGNANCATPGSTITSVTAGTGLNGGGSSGTVAVNCNTAAVGTPGCVQPDGSTITASGGVLSAAGAFVPEVLEFTTSTYPSGLGCSGSSGSYTCTGFPTGNHICRFTAVSGAGGGGSGATCSNSSTCYGGGGGAGGLAVDITEPCALLGGGSTATVTVTVGAGGTAGAAQSSNSSSGNPGGNGALSSIAGASGYGKVVAETYSGGTGGTPGQGGTTSTGTGGAATTSYLTNANCAGGTGSSGSPGSQGCLGVTNPGPQGGSGAAGLISGTAAAGGGQYPLYMLGNLYTNISGGTSGGGSATTPTYASSVSIANLGLYGLGGPGGGSNCSGNGGSGATGMVPGGGGGGGGAACNGSSSGAGGAGGAGVVRVIVQ